MWPNLRKKSAGFASAVLSGLDAEGYPFSIRCVPTFDDAQQVVRIARAGGASIEAGRANLLFHKHDEQLWGLEMMLVLGSLEERGEEWILRPERVLPDSGQGPIQTIMAARRSARDYLAKRGLARPRISWDRIRSFYPRQERSAPASQPDTAA